MRRQFHVPVLKQALQRKPRQIGRRKTALLSQSLKLRTLRRRQPELKSRRINHDAQWTQYVLRGNALPILVISPNIEDTTNAAQARRGPLPLCNRRE